MRGPLAAEFYYVYAMDERGAEWKGKSLHVHADHEFRISGRQDCFVRGFDRTGFFEVDTGTRGAQLDGAIDRPGARAGSFRPLIRSERRRLPGIGPSPRRTKFHLTYGRIP